MSVFYQTLTRLQNVTSRHACLMRVLGPLTDYLYVKEGRAYADTEL
jgi:hypothetical protein